MKRLLQLCIFLHIIIYQSASAALFELDAVITTSNYVVSYSEGSFEGEVDGWRTGDIIHAFFNYSNSSSWVADSLYYDQMGLSISNGSESLHLPDYAWPHFSAVNTSDYDYIKIYFTAGMGPHGGIESITLNDSTGTYFQGDEPGYLPDALNLNDFSSITLEHLILNEGGGDAYSREQIIATVVPLPTSIILFLSGIAGLVRYAHFKT
ncbi:MAG: hypothetical protein P8179_16675 [Candidatus Thiodiazotropha sp.]